MKNLQDIVPSRRWHVGVIGAAPRPIRVMPWSAAVLLCIAGSLLGQAPTIDADRRGDPFTDIAANGTYEGQPAWLVTGVEPIRSGKFRIQGSLVVQAGGLARFEDAVVEVVGDVYLEDGGTLRLIDSDFSVFNTGSSRTYNYWWRGGHLDTRRCLIGGRQQTRRIANFYLDRGLWTCRDTTVHYSGGILIGDHELPVDRQAGRLIADGLYPGENPDAVRMNSSGHAILRNSRFAVAVRLFDRGAANVVIPFDVSDSLIRRAVYGDAAFHSGVTVDIPGSPWRLELEDCTVSRWSLQFFDVSPTAPAQTYELQNANWVGIGIHADDLVGTPVLVGPWSSYYPVLPGLPTASAPGQHGIPPGCGIRFGSLTIRSPASAWSYISAWNLYLDGPATDYAIRGPMQIAEVFVSAGTLRLEGLEGYDASCDALTARAYETGHLILRDMTLGSPATRGGELEVTGRGRATVERVKLRRLTLRTGPQRLPGPNRGVAQGAITMRDFVLPTASGEEFTQIEDPPGSIQVRTAGPSESFDYQNLDFAGGLVGAGRPAYWAGSPGLGFAVSSDVSPGSSDRQSLAISSSAGSGLLEKRPVLSNGARVELFGWVRLTGGTGSVRLAVEGSSGARSATVVPGGSSDWQFVQVPGYVVQPGDAHVSLRVETTGAVQARIDDFAIRVPEFWEDDNLSNLDFEIGRQRNLGVYPDRFNPMDYWTVFGGSTAIETADLGPGTAGNVAARMTVEDANATLRKRLEFVRPGRTVTFRGAVKGISAGGARTDIYAFVGRGNQFFATGANQRLFTNAGWQSFAVSWTVTPGTPFTSLVVFGSRTGDEILIDDCQVTIR